MTHADIPLHVVFVEAWIKRGDTYLLAKRSSKDDQAAGKWAVPGGKIEMELEGNIVENSLKREVKEEVGIEVDRFQFLASRSFIRSSGHHVVALSFIANYVSGEAMPLEDQDEVRWVTIQEMENLLDSHWTDSVHALKNVEKKKVGVGFGVMMLRDGKVLLGKRHEDPNKADTEFHEEGTWTFPGGKLEYGESFEEGAKREILEEAGIRLIDVKVIAVNNDKNEHAHFVTIGLFSDSFTGEPEVMEPDEITEWRWFDVNDLPSPMYFPSMKLLENYKQKKFYLS